MKYILTIDAGTTSVRALLFNREKMEIERVERESFKQYFPKPAWVEHDGEEIWKKVKSCILRVSKGIDPKEIYGIGITNQRETAVAFSKSTGKALYHAICWQCRRTTKFCENLKRSRMGKIIHSKTGLIPDAYFSASKYKWLLENSSEVKRAKEENDLCLSTIESFLVYKLTNGKSFVSDYTNACRTMLFNIKELKWDKDLLKFFQIDESFLPKVVGNDEIVGETTILGKPIKVAGLIGDQQGSLFGQGCFEKKLAKNTYGTGAFMLVNTGSEIKRSRHGCLTTIAYKIKNKTCYALEGSVFNAGSTVDWAINNLGIGKNPRELTDLALKIDNNEGVYLVPAFTGLGSPYWDMRARGTIVGLTRSSNKSHIARAVLESLCYTSLELLQTLEKDSHEKIKELHIDGGASQNGFVASFQADIMGIKLKKYNVESTCMGAMFMTGLATNAFKDLKEIKGVLKCEKEYLPTKDEEEVKPLILGYKKAVKRALTSK